MEYYSKENANKISAQFMENIGTEVLKNVIKQDEIHLYVIISVAGQLYGRQETPMIKTLLYGLQMMATVQLSKHGVDHPLSDEDNSFSDNYRAWFAFWTNHFNEMGDDLKDSFVSDFIAENDLKKYYPEGNFENIPMGSWMNLTFPKCFEPLLDIGFF